MLGGGVGELSLFTHFIWNEQAKLFGGDHRPLTSAVTSGLCICKTLKRINIAAHWAPGGFACGRFIVLEEEHETDSGKSFIKNMWQNIELYVKSNTKLL